jgi:4-aminobutyrate aminotransferase/4-aminobutyrate aminotransferase/(S)-3-amino-2-methylpropionate transaminase
MTLEVENAAPKAKNGSARATAAIPRGVARAHAVFAEHARNAELFDDSGRRYIDFCGGIAVLNTGHCHPRVVEAVSAQLQRFTHTCFQVVPYDIYITLAERLCALAPGPTPKKAFFMTTGAEACENAIKIARAHTRRSGVIAFAGGFHGRTMMTLALTGKIAPYKVGFGPFPPEVFHARYPCELHGVSVGDAIDSIHTIFKSEIESQRVAAIVVEPITGEGGYYPAPAEFLRELRELCDQKGILLVADEIQTGVGRTGAMYAIEHSGVEADIMTLAKGLGGGFPISAVVGKAHVMDAVEPGGLGGTFAGSPIGCAAGLAVLDAIEQEHLLERARRLGAHLQARLRALSEVHPAIGDVRGRGMMVAFELFDDRGRRQPAGNLARELVAAARDRGLLLLTCGPHGNVIRVMAPLTIPEPVLDEGIDILADAFNAVRRTFPGYT